MSLLMSGSGSLAQDGRLEANCYRVAELAPAQVHCDLRTTGSGRRPEVETVTVRLADGKQVKNTFEVFSPKARSSAWLFLIQSTDHPRDGARTAEQLIRSDTKRSYGVYSFSESSEEIWRIGSGEDARRALEKARAGSGTFSKPGGGKPALYASAREAIQKLAAFSADRRALVIVGTGAANLDANRGYGEKDVITLARENNIVIHTIALTGNAGGDAQNLKRLADETGGVYEPSPAYEGKEHKPLSAEFVENFPDYLENGGLAKLASNDVPDKTELLITASLKGGSRPLTVDKVAVQAAKTPIYQPAPWQAAVDWIGENQLMTGLGAALAAALVAWAFFLRRKPEPLPAVVGGGDMLGASYGSAFDDHTTGRKAAAGYDATMTSGETIILTPTNDRNPPKQVYAWLEFMDQNATRVPIGATTVRIGRHDDNDICLANKSVHRQHAVLHMSPDNSFVIRDLGTRNGVIVNKQRIDQRQLADGDVIELGEVRARFVAGNATRH